MSRSFDDVASVYDRTRVFPPEAAERVADTIERLTRAGPETRFLEPGIGTGRVTWSLIRRGYAYTGLDVSEAMMDQLRRKARGVPNRLTLVGGDAAAMPFPDRSFDVVLTTHLLHLLPEWRKVMDEIARVLRPGGVFLYCREVSRRDAPLYEAWRSILEAHDALPLPPGGSESDVLGYLTERGASLETVTGATWTVRQTAGELLEYFERRYFSSLWQVPDDVFPIALAELREWCGHNLGSPDAEVTSDLELRITAARGLAEL